MGLIVFAYGRVHINERLASLEILDAEMKVGRQNGDDGATHVIEDQGFADNVRRRAKLTLPQTLGNHDRGIRSQAVFLGSESPPAERRDAQNLEEPGGDHLATQVFRLASA